MCRSHNNVSLSLSPILLPLPFLPPTLSKNRGTSFHMFKILYFVHHRYFSADFHFLVWHERDFYLHYVGVMLSSILCEWPRS